VWLFVVLGMLRCRLICYMCGQFHMYYYQSAAQRLGLSGIQYCDVYL
jgi:hypothetical protein